MNDLISRREVTVILDKYRVPDSVYYEINKLPEFSAENKGEWIPVSERLPEESGRYLTYIVNEYDKEIQYQMIADYIAITKPIEGQSLWCVDDECASDNVVAWQPLPEPYKAESEDKAETDTEKERIFNSFMSGIAEGLVEVRGDKAE